VPDPIWVKAVLKALVLPPTGPLLLAAFGIVMLGRWPRAGRALAAGGVALLLALSMPAVATLLLCALDSSPPLDPERAKAAQAIVILGGGIRRNALEYGGDTLGRLTLERVRYGAQVARLTGLPVLVAGGSVYGGATEASLMWKSLETEYGIPVRWGEDKSRTTHENAVNAGRILHEAGIGRVVLVAHSFDMPRATAEFSAAGIETILAPTGIPGALDLPLDLLPSVAGLQASYYACYEILANAVRMATPGR
jgi:uncharacterized SAM-binding protein YcdF (DUF218 family)